MHRRPRLLRDPVGRVNEAENQGLSVDESDDHERENRQANGKSKEPVLKITAAQAGASGPVRTERRKKKKVRWRREACAADMVRLSINY